MQDAMFGEEEPGQLQTKREVAVTIAYEATACGLLADMVTYLAQVGGAGCCWVPMNCWLVTLLPRREWGVGSVPRWRV